MIKNFLDSDDQNDTGPASASAGSSIFGGLSENPPSETLKKERANESIDPFAVSDYRGKQTIENVPVENPPQTQADPQHQQIEYTPPTPSESARMSGLAFTAGIAFVSSVVFMLILGWLVDIIIGTAPWGIVSGIVLGSVIGFIQFFRLNSQILRSQNSPRSTSFLDLNASLPPGETAPLPEEAERNDRDEGNRPENTSSLL